MADKLDYNAADGSVIDTGTEVGVRRALADVSHRLLAVETAPVASGGGGADGDRLARLEEVTGGYFREAFNEYDGTHAAAKPVEPATPATGGPGGVGPA